MCQTLKAKLTTQVQRSCRSSAACASDQSVCWWSSRQRQGSTLATASKSVSIRQSFLWKQISKRNQAHAKRALVDNGAKAGSAFAVFQCQFNIDTSLATNHSNRVSKQRSSSQPVRPLCELIRTRFHPCSIFRCSSSVGGRHLAGILRLRCSGQAQCQRSKSQSPSVSGL